MLARRSGPGARAYWVALGLAGFAWGTRAVAAPSARLVYLRNPGAETCPDDAAIRSAVAARLGYDPFVGYAPSTMFAEISRVKTGYHARIKLVDADNVVRGTRELSHPSDQCADIVDAMALSMSIAIDPDSLLGPKPRVLDDGGAPTSVVYDASSESKLAPAPTAPTAPAPPADPSAPVREASGPALHLEAGLGPSLWFGAAPAPNLGAHLFARLRGRWLSLGLEGRADLPASRDVSAGTVQTSLVLVGVSPCAHLEWEGRLPGALGLCGVAALGSLRATSRNVTTPLDDSAIHAALGPRLVLEIPLFRGFSLGARAEGLATLTPQSLRIDGADAYTLSRFSLGVGLGAIVRFF